VDNTSTFSGNGDNRVYYYGSTIGHDTSIADPGIPYRVDNIVYISLATLTIDPGVELQFDPNTFLQVGYYGTGTLVANGTDEANIKFTSGSETPATGDWHGVYFSNLTGDGSILKSAIVEYGGKDDWGSVYVNNSSPTIRECTIRHSLNFGVTVVNPSAYPELYCNTITANSIGIHVEGNANPTIHDNDIRGNTTYGVRNLNLSQVVDASDNYWGASDGPSGFGPGSGDAVSANVLYDPFLPESAPCTVPLNADFAAGPTEGCEELTVNFTDGSTGDVIAWEWDFGDGSSSNEQNPVHTYTEPDTYTVTLIVYEGEEDVDTEVKEDYITVTESVPTADFDGGPLLSGTPPLTVNFTDLSTMCGTDTITAWAWDFDSNGVIDDSEANPTFDFLDAGHYTVSLMVTDNDGDQDTKTRTDYIYVSDENPVADPGGPYSEIEGQPIHFDSSGSYDPNGGELTCDWDFGDGSAHSSAINPSHVYAQDSEEQPGGVYTVTLTVFDEGGLSGTNTATANVTDIDPVADFSADTISGPAPLDVNFTDQTYSYDGVTSWIWDFGDNSGPVTEQNPSHTYNVPDTYAVTLTVTEDDGDTDVEEKVEYIEVAGECETDEDCDDGDLCTTDSCVDGECVFEPVDCDDGDPNTNDYCDPDTGECVHEPIGCEINEIPGDLDGDCDVDGADRNILRASLRKCEGDEGYNADADYDGDGCITFGDYRIWYGHYKAFQSGAG
jgi:parallel beta-helix repeat protein